MQINYNHDEAAVTFQAKWFIAVEHLQKKK